LIPQSVNVFLELT